MSAGSTSGDLIQAFIITAVIVAGLTLLVPSDGK